MNRLLEIIALGALGLTAATADAAVFVGHGRSTSARQDIAANLIEQGIGAFNKRRYSASISMLNKALEMNPNSAETHFYLGRARYFSAQRSGYSADLNGIRSAVSEYEAAQRLDPALRSISDPFLFHDELAMCNLALRRYPDAIAGFQQAMDQAPNNPMPAIYASAAFALNNNPTRSSDAFMSALHRARRVHALRSIARAVRDDSTLSKVLAIPKNRALLESYEQVDRGVVSEAQAIASLNREPAEFHDALAARPAALLAARPPAKDSRTIGLLKKADRDLKFQDYHDALARYRAVLETDKGKGSLTAVDRSKVYERMAHAYREMGLTREAIRMLEFSTEEAPLNPFAHYQLSLAYCVSGRLSKSLNSLQLALQSAANPHDLRKLVLLARTDPELVPIRDLADYRKLIAAYKARI